jgi:hypothetical protein
MRQRPGGNPAVGMSSSKECSVIQPLNKEIIPQHALPRATNSVVADDPAPVTAVAVMSNTIIEDINRENRLRKESAKNALQHAIQCGELLMMVKKRQVPHGGFTQWVELNCEFSPRSARAFMQLAALTQNGSALPFSSIRQALLPEEAAPRSKPKRDPATDTDGADADDAEVDAADADSVAGELVCAVNRGANVEGYKAAITAIEHQIDMTNCSGSYADSGLEDIEPEQQRAALELTLRIFKRVLAEQIETNQQHEESFKRRRSTDLRTAMAKREPDTDRDGDDPDGDADGPLPYVTIKAPGGRRKKIYAKKVIERTITSFFGIDAGLDLIGPASLAEITAADVAWMEASLGESIASLTRLRRKLQRHATTLRTGGES